MIHLDGMVYTYVVQSNTLVSPQATSYLTRSDTYSWLTLVTCQNYDELTDTYRFRRVVRAVLVSVSTDD
jgi:sortase (surface protein transpeptidase)